MGQSYASSQSHHQRNQAGLDWYARAGIHRESPRARQTRLFHAQCQFLDMRYRPETLPRQMARSSAQQQYEANFLQNSFLAAPAGETHLPLSSRSYLRSIQPDPMQVLPRLQYAVQPMRPAVKVGHREDSPMPETQECQWLAPVVLMHPASKPVWHHRAPHTKSALWLRQVRQPPTYAHHRDNPKLSHLIQFY